MKRVISIVLVLCLLPAALAVPALAAEAVPASVYDLLTALEYTCSVSNGGLTVSDRPYVSVSNTSYVQFLWTSSVDFVADRIVIAVECDIRPTDVKTYDGEKYLSLTFDSSHNGIHYYSISGSSVFNPYRVFVSINSGYSGVVGLYSVYGFLDDAIDVSTVNYFTNVMIGDPVLGYREVESVDSGSAMLPVASEWYGPYDYAEGEELLYAECYYKAPAPFDYGQSVSFLVYTIGEIQNVGARLETSSGSVIAGLTSSVQACGDSQIVVQFDEEMYRCKVYVVSVDLQGYSLIDRVITLSYEVLPVHSSGALEWSYGFYSQLTAAAFLPLEAESNLFSRFVSWLRGRFDDVNATIATWGQNIIDAINPPESDISAGDTLVQQGQQIHEFEQQQQQILHDSVGTLQQFSNIGGFSASLSFVSGYLTKTFDALGDFQIVITLPLVIGVILFLASRVRGFDKPHKHNELSYHTKQVVPKSGGMEGV